MNLSSILKIKKNNLVAGDLLKDEPRFRLTQIAKYIFQDLIENWEQATSIPKVLRDKLNKNSSLTMNSKLIASKHSPTIKSLITLKDREKIETVLMRHKDGRNTVCVSTQAGCALGCVFCATGRIGFRRNLSWDEIVAQVILFQRILKKENRRVTNVVYMGMGEPMLNYENVLQSVRILNAPKGLNIGARKISISTVGITEGIDRLANEDIQVNLAVSLHAPVDSLRNEMMPINKKYPIQKILESVTSYFKMTHRKVMFEYVLIAGVNDSLEYAEMLVQLLRKYTCMLNLIKMNPVYKFHPPKPEQIKRFKEILEKGGLEVVQRYSFGQDIKAACGQLAGGEGNIQK
ncbi:MAG: 23S rRNA (adenine(2503)-C(2))-methyltransferase RlmN [Candidatus Dojkabacteria bacterium]|nr:23S rRNA (adenine(2503)-C(2))-methyltransferase RlmN [Candidatus Dojkabacteria bacterium]